MLNIKHFIVSISLAGSLFLSGCSWFFSSDQPEREPENRNIVLQIVATNDLNPTSGGVAQPVKMCVVELNREGWSPPGLYQGRACSDIQPDKDVLSVTPFIMAPMETRTFIREVPYRQDRWLVIAVEFQTLGKDSVIQLKSGARNDFNPVVLVDGNRLLPLARAKP
ncbi:type VI secretion lipoprotein TssJ [Trabulsiella odontotermitis]|uniref:type VI secretion lipoprotein TssJ n=1 Tax=Trabulsiella odontotermitis TaxID=379893 RepID=UPI003AC93810